MESNEVESMVIALLKSDGYSNFKFEWLIKPEKSNVWQCIVKADNQIFSFNIDDDSKQILSKKSIKKLHKLEWNETVIHSNHIKVEQKGIRKIQNTKMSALLIVLFIIAPIVGYFIEPSIGLIVGVLIGGISFVIGSYVVSRERIHSTYEK